MNKKSSKDLPSKKILGMPVYSCTEGLFLGNVRNILINAVDYEVQGFVLERRRAARDERILPFEAVHSFGEDGITVSGAARLERIGQSSKYIRALRHPLNIIGCRAFTTAGRTLGKAEEYRFDSTTGKICGFEISPDGFFRTRTLVKGKHLVAIAGHTIMLHEDAADDAVDIENTFLNNVSNAAEAVREKAGELVSGTAQFTRKLSANINDKFRRKDQQQEEPLQAASATDNEPDTDKENADIKNADMENVGAEETISDIVTENVQNEAAQNMDEELFIEKQADGEILMDADDSLTQESRN